MSQSIVRLICPHCQEPLKLFGLFWYCLKDSVLIHGANLEREMNKRRRGTE